MTEVMTVAEYRALISKSKKRDVRSRSVGGKRDDLGFYVRSRWEANYVRLLRFLNQRFEYEAKEFRFPVDRGTMTYLPDFYLPDKDQYIELKGHLDQRSKVQLSRFMQFFPVEAKRMRIVIKEIFNAKAKLTKDVGILLKLGYEMDQILEYKAWHRQFNGVIPNWEA